MSFSSSTASPRPSRISTLWRSLLVAMRGRLSHAERFRLVALAVVVGLLGGLGAVAVRHLIGAAQNLFFGTSGGLVAAAVSIPAWKYALMPAVGGLIIGPMIWYGAREARGHGVPEVMLAVLLRGGRIRPRVAIVKALASAISIGSGGSAGREGPMVQIGSSLGSTIGQLARVPTSGLTTLVGAGAAAGIAAAFNAPIAGAMFALEVILGDFTVAAFSPVVVAAVTATVVSRSLEGDFAAFLVPKHELVSVWEFLPFAGLGVAAGLIAVLFVVLLYWQEKVWERLRFPEPLKPALGGLGIGAIALLFPHVLGVGYETMSGALSNSLPWLLLLMLIPLKLIATSVTLGSGGSGGIFAPSLFVGAALGNCVGQGVQAWAPHAAGAPGAYALVGMGAVVAATTHAPLTAILILFELTGDYRLILPLMTSCILATLVASLIKSNSIYTQKLDWQGIRMKEGREESLLRSFSVRSLMSGDFTRFQADTPISEVLSRTLVDSQETYPVVDSQDHLVGVIRFRDLRSMVRDDALNNSLVVAADVALPPFQVSPDDNLQEAMSQLSAHEVHGLPVVQDGKVVGLLYKEPVLALYTREIKKLELAETLVSRQRFRATVPGVDLGDGLRLHEIPVSEEFVGQTLREADLRRVLGMEVLFLRRGEDGPRVFPDPDLVLGPKHRLVVLASPDSLVRLPGGRPSAD
ncbi:MAG: chloride channel protein [Thermoanaerobaculia bacterium]|nr:chloride channel protein [Thermoanaerobaculia bacterium]